MEWEKTMPVGSLQAVTKSVEGQTIEKALRETGGNKVRAAAILGISRAALYEKMKKLRLARTSGAEIPSRQTGCDKERKR